MPGVAVTGIDSAGGIIQPTQVGVTFNELPVAVVGCAVTGHGGPPHNAASMVQGSAIFKINGIPVCLAGMLASCGDRATGRPNFTCGA